MKIPDLQLLYNAFKLLRAGEWQQSLTILNELEHTYPDNSNLKLWRIFITQDSVEAQQVFQKLRTDAPKHPGLPLAEKWLQLHQLRAGYQRERKLGNLTPEEVAVIEEVAHLTGLAGFLGIEEKKPFPFFLTALAFTALIIVALFIFPNYGLPLILLLLLGIIFSILAFFYERTREAVQAGKLAWNVFRLTEGRLKKAKAKQTEENVINQ